MIVPDFRFYEKSTLGCSLPLLDRTVGSAGSGGRGQEKDR